MTRAIFAQHNTPLPSIRVRIKTARAASEAAAVLDAENSEAIRVTAQYTDAPIEVAGEHAGWAIDAVNEVIRAAHNEAAQAWRNTIDQRRSQRV